MRVFNDGVARSVPVIVHTVGRGRSAVVMNTFLREDLHGMGFAIAIGRVREAALELLDVVI